MKSTIVAVGRAVHSLFTWWDHEQSNENKRDNARRKWRHPGSHDDDGWVCR